MLGRTDEEQPSRPEGGGPVMMIWTSKENIEVEFAEEIDDVNSVERYI